MTAKKYIRNGRPHYRSRMKRNFQYLGLFIFFTVYIINSSALLKELFLNWWNTPTTTTVYAAESVTVMPVSATVSPSPSPVLEQVQVEGDGDEYKHTKEHIDYFKTIFGSEWKIALAVAQNECNSSRPEWPKCKNSNSKEFSIGWMQINLAQDNGEGAWIHASKVPGKTIAEKQEYLNDPFNNILIAKIIKDRSGWNAWTAYSSGNYKKDL